MDLVAGKNLSKADGTTATSESVLGSKSVVCFYFSAHWCPPCRQFTQILKDFYKSLEEANQTGLEIIFVSSDRSPGDMSNYMKTCMGDWWSVAHGSDLAQQLKQRFAITGIPCLIVVKVSTGEIITKDGRSLVQSKGPSIINEWL